MIKIADCPECVKHYMRQPFLMEAFASVGISQGKSTKQMASEYFTAFHKRGHKELK